jgi:NTE family protein
MILRSSLFTGCFAGLLLFLAGCSVLPSIPVFGQINERILDNVQQAVTAPSNQAAVASQPIVARAIERPGVAALRNNLFVGLGISGGGSRAANFATAVMQELETLGLMQQVTVMSSVSGGGLPAAWYGLHGSTLTADNTAGWQQMRTAMAFDFRSEWQHGVLAPHNLLATAVSGLNRSDIMIDVFDRRLFNGATFAALGAPGVRRPIVLFNATDITREGVGFAFSEESFNARNSRLDTYPIARAVMASGAFPGAFSSVALRNHAPRRPDGSISPDASFTHLMDGGPADNYGIDKLLQAARSGWEAGFGCLFIVIDSHITNHAGARANDRDLRKSPLDFLLDPNVFDAVDTLLAQRRSESLAKVGLKLQATERYITRQSHGSRFYAQAKGGVPRLVYRYAPTATFELPVSDLQSDASKPGPQCRTWHISLNELRSIASGVALDATGLPDIEDATLQNRALLWELVTRISTDYRLTGPASCSPSQLQQALVQSANEAVQSDALSRSAVCELVGKHASVPQCAAQSSAAAGVTIAETVNVRPDAQALGTVVNCVAAAQP